MQSPLLEDFENKNSTTSRKFNINTKKILDFSRTKNDPYTTTGIDINKIDLFYVYTWGPEIPYIAKLFSEYANKESILLINSGVWPANTKKLMKNFNLEIKKQSTYVEYVGIIDKIPHIFAKIKKISTPHQNTMHYSPANYRDF